MQDHRMSLSGEISNPKPPRRKVSTTQTSLSQLQGNDVREIQHVQAPISLTTRQKASKRNLKAEPSPQFQQPERSNSDSFPDSTTSGDEYRSLRRKYLLLEEESFALGKALRDVEDNVKTLEDEKLALLDQLVVLEGLIDPLEVQSHRFKLP